MAKEIVRSEKRELDGRNKAVAVAKERHAPRKHAKKAAKHAAKKHAKKASRHVGEAIPGLQDTGGRREGLRTAFHHMQRASVVISLMEKGTGEDLRDLLERGVKLYQEVLAGEGGKRTIARSVGILRAAEHLAMAGLYSARERYRQKVAKPAPEWLKESIAKTGRRLEAIEDEPRGRGIDLHPVSVELLRQAADADHDAHLAYELAMAADALCFALENGL